MNSDARFRACFPSTFPETSSAWACCSPAWSPGILKRKHVGMACDYLIDNMSIFFVPAGVGIMGCVSRSFRAQRRSSLPSSAS
jgi:hypothetical protein